MIYLDLKCRFRHGYELFKHKRFFPFVRRFMPRWLVVQALIKASVPGKGVAYDEIVTDVPFMRVYSRWFDGSFPGWRVVEGSVDLALDPVKET